MKELVPHFIIILIITVISYVILHRYFPVNGTTKAANKRKGFLVWSLTILLFFLESLFVYITYSVETIEDLKKEFHEGVGLMQNLDDESKNTFRELIRSYSSFSKDQKDKRFIDDKFLQEIKKLSRELNEGFIIINEKASLPSIMNLYDKAENSILATNVGSLSSFFGHPAYIHKNIEKFYDTIPIIRIYLYLGSDDISQDGDTMKTYQVFKDKVIRLHGDMKTFCSIMINTKDLKGFGNNELRDFLIVDSKYLSESKLNSNQEMLYDKVSTSDNQIQGAIAYLRKIMEVPHEVIYSKNGNKVYLEKGEKIYESIFGKQQPEFITKPIDSK